MFGLGVVSLLLSQVRIKSVHGRIIAVAFLATAVLVSGTVFYTTNELITGLAGAPTISTVSGTLVVQQSSGNDSFSVMISDNSADGSPITNVTVLNECSHDCPGSNGTISNADSLVLSFHGAPVSAQNPLPVGPTAIGTIETSGVTIGATYHTDVVVTFQNGNVAKITLYVTAQA